MTQESTPDRPLVTFALFAYNQEKYIREAIEGAFSQTYEPLEIILSDDCSTDGTFEVMQELMSTYDGPHQVYLRRNKKNTGIAEHVNLVIQTAKGKFLVTAAGDDISLPERTERTVDILLKNEGFGFCETSCITINENGRENPKKALQPNHTRNITLSDLLQKRATGLTGACRTYNLDFIKLYPKLNKECPTEDSTFVLRCLLLGKGAYLSGKYTKRRIHGENLSGKKYISRMHLKGIWSQYKMDLAYAYEKKFIGVEDLEKVNNWIEKVSYQRDLHQRLANNQSKIFKEILEIKNSGGGLRVIVLKLLILFKAYAPWVKN